MVGGKSQLLYSLVLFTLIFFCFVFVGLIMFPPPGMNVSPLKDKFFLSFSFERFFAFVLLSSQGVLFVHLMVEMVLFL